MALRLDSQGILRGECRNCKNCKQYEIGNSGASCQRCNCKPIYHQEAPQTCRLHGCSKPAFKENGMTHDYCGKTHAMEARMAQHSKQDPKTVQEPSYCKLPSFQQIPRTQVPSNQNHPFICLWIDIDISQIFQTYLKDKLNLESKLVKSEDSAHFRKSQNVRLAVQLESLGSPRFEQEWKRKVPHIPLLTVKPRIDPYSRDLDWLFQDLQRTLSHESNNLDRSQKRIEFYNANEPYYEFTNFFDAPFSLDGKRWPTSEHYFQAHKFLILYDQDVIRSCSTPRDAFSKARSMDHLKRPDWESVKDEVMHRAVMAKFSQNAVLEKLLLSTGDAYLVEHTANDRYWGDGGDGSGKNKLGYTLMAIRNELGTSSQQLQIEGCDLRHELTSTPSYRPPPPSSLQMSQTSASSVTTSSATSSPTSFLTSSPMTSSPTRDTKPVTSGLVNQRRSAFESTPSQSESRHKKR
eukprot:TRINITY_DN1476_c0_g1_i1.p1 TRINITY_DN1476_c0_g1~~TRINITY_DN1476_c0_g1_i1.p1  ORF type:complete len:463 (-),score=37.82 TRINITY_DN1476_c0_g1_i1:53-1441(-)